MFSNVLLFYEFSATNSFNNVFYVIFGIYKLELEGNKGHVTTCDFTDEGACISLSLRNL